MNDEIRRAIDALIASMQFDSPYASTDDARRALEDAIGRAVAPTKLRPCPLCGADAEHIHIFEGEEIVRCTAGSACGVGLHGDTQKNATERWNRRAS